MLLFIQDKKTHIWIIYICPIELRMRKPIGINHWNHGLQRPIPAIALLFHSDTFSFCLLLHNTRFC